MDTFYLDVELGIPKELLAEPSNEKLREALASSIILTLGNFFQTSAYVVGGIRVRELSGQEKASIDLVVKSVKERELLMSMDISSQLPN